MFGVSNNLNKHIKVNHYVNSTGMIASFLLIIMALLASFPIVSHTDIVEAITPVESETEIAMSIGKSSADLEIIPKDASGTFASSSASDLAEFNVTTNNYTGYTLGIEGTDDNGLLTNDDTSITTNNTLASITTILDSSTFNTAAYNNKWGYKPSKYNSVDNVSFHPAPTTDGSILDVTNSANTADANTYTIGLGTRVDQTKPTGIYTNTFILTAVGNPVTYSIEYTDTSGDMVSGIPSTQSGSTLVTNVTLSNTVPTRTGYNFAGWCDGIVDHVTNGNSSCRGTTYAARSSYDFINQTIANNNVTLTAVWTLASYLQTVQVRYQNANGTWGDYVTYAACTRPMVYGEIHTCFILADDTYQAATLSYTVTGEDTKQIDIYRNTKTVSLTKGTGISAVSVTGTGVKTGSGTASATVYYGGTVTIAATLTSGYDWVNWTGSATYSNRSQSVSSITSDLSFTANGRVSCQSSISGTMQAFNPCSSLTGSGTLRDSRSGNKSYTVAKIGSLWWMTRNLDLPGGTTITPSDSNVTSNYTLPASSASGWNNYSGQYVYNSGSTSCGNNSPCYSYYSYKVAAAGAEVQYGYEATSDICPKGWRLPTKAEIETLINTYTLVASDFLVSYSGEYNSFMGFSEGGTDAYYWSATTVSYSDAYHLRINSSSGASMEDDSKEYGFSVRCVKS